MNDGDDTTQRWRRGRASYRPAREVIDLGRFEIDTDLDELTAKAFTERHHYSGTWPAARERVGLRDRQRRGELAGVACFSHPVHDAVLDVLPNGRDEGVELGRFVLLDYVGANAETWMLARAFEYLRGEGYTGVLSFSDPVPRATGDGGVVMPGHVGLIYQALNATYTGRGRAEPLWLLPSGQAYSRRTQSKIRGDERGIDYAISQLLAAGAARVQGDADDWLDEWLPRLCRKVPHPGNHRYVWAIDRRRRGDLKRNLLELAKPRRDKSGKKRPPRVTLGLPYPKTIDRIAA